MNDPGLSPKGNHAQQNGRPVALCGDLANLPEALEPLTKLPHWVGWKWEWRVDKGSGNWTKPPLQPKTPSRYASNNDPKTWGSYQDALAAFENGRCDGIGFNLMGADIAALDLDDCRDPVTGAVIPEVSAIVDRAESYTEVTPSGTGLRVIGYGYGAKTHRKQKIPGTAAQVESYRGAERYITITGLPLPGILDACPNLIDISETIDAVVAKLDGNGTIDQGNGKRYERADDLKPDDLLSPQLKALIANTPPAEDMSSAFHHAVCWLHELKWSARKIERYIAGKPVVPQRYKKRLQQEIDRCLLNSKESRKQAKAKQHPQKASTISGEELDAMRFEAIRYVVPDILVEGLTLLAGKPKIGKSWLLLHAAIAVSCGGLTLGGIQCVEGDVLYCALEDNLRRLQSRMEKLLGGRGGWPKRLHFRCEMPRLAEGGLDEIRDWITRATHPRLVIIDTLAMVRAPKGREQSSYDADYDAVKALRDMANVHNVAIVIVHHLRKAVADDAFDTVSGTLGLTGAPDSVLVVQYDANGIVLHGKGRDLIELQKALAFDRDACTWSITGDAMDVRRSSERATILAAFIDPDEVLGPVQIAAATGMKPNNIRFLLHKMVADDEIERVGYGKYRLASP